LATTLQFANETTLESPWESPSAQVMARLYFATFLAILFTGAIRKWLAPGVTVLYLLQDVPIGIAYFYALSKGCFNRGFLFLGIVILSAVLLLQGLAQIIISGLDLFVALAGFHNYLFYLPMLIVFPYCLTEKYRKKFVWWNLILSIPMCLLAITQALSPKSAWVNQTTGGDAFGVPGADIARVSGTFNFVAFYATWVGIAVALCMGEWLLPKERRAIRNQWLLILCTFTVNLCHLVSASRAAILLAGLGVLGAMAGAIVLGSNRAILAIMGICVLSPVAAGMTYVISPTEFNVVVDRFSGGTGESDLAGRVLTGFLGFAIVPRFSLIGAGIGMGVDAAHVGKTDTYNFTYDLSEQDTIRNVMELGTPVGLLYVLTRVAFTYAMIFLSIRLVRSGSSPHVLPLSFVILGQSYADLTRNATMSATQVMIGYAFILGVYYHPDAKTSLDFEADDSLMRSA
jgi:uncharacterized membrane protein